MEQNNTNKLFEYYSIKKLYEDKMDTLKNDLIKDVNYNELFIELVESIYKNFGSLIGKELLK